MPSEPSERGIAKFFQPLIKQIHEPKTIPSKESPKNVFNLKESSPGHHGSELTESLDNEHGPATKGPFWSRSNEPDGL